MNGRWLHAGRYAQYNQSNTMKTAYETLMSFPIILFGIILTMSIANASEFEVGQRWAYHTRPVEKGSTLTIVKIDEIKNDKIIHISIEGVKIKNPEIKKGFGENVSHMPISEKALQQSVTTIIENVKTLPDFEEGYAIWKNAYDQGQGGYFTIPVMECVEYMEKTFNQ